MAKSKGDNAILINFIIVPFPAIFIQLTYSNTKFRDREIQHQKFYRSPNWDSLIQSMQIDIIDGTSLCKEGNCEWKS